MNEEKWVKCTKCGIRVPPVFPDGDDTFVEQVEDGIELIFSVGYGMFSDNLAEGNPVAFLCHDCVVQLLDFFPKSFRDRFKKGHPWSHKPNGVCCEYSWNFEYEGN